MDGSTVRVYDEKGKQRSSLNLEQIPTVSKGFHTIKFNTQYGDDENTPEVLVVFKSIGIGEVVKSN